MTITLKQLCQNLSLTTDYEQKSQLETIEDWCYNTVSQDLRYSGSAHEQYHQYLELARDYLDEFLPHVPAKLEKKVQQFDDLNAIQYAAQKGYDRFISAQTVPDEQILNEVDEDGMSALHNSAAEGFVHTVQALLAKGADAKKPNEHEQLPIQSALFLPMSHDDKLMQRKEDIFRALLQKTPDVLTRHDDNGDTLLHRMAVRGFANLMTEVLASNSKLAFLKNNDLCYPIHSAILNQQEEAIDVLLRIEGVAALNDGDQRVALHYAARCGTAAIVSKCCRVTPDINIRDAGEKTPLHWAAISGNQGAMEFLLRRGADVMATDHEGFSILHHAIQEQNEPMVSWIVRHAPPDLLNQRDANGHSPLFHAQEINNGVIEQLLVSHGAVNLPSLRM